jgi:hypothetical protein
MIRFEDPDKVIHFGSDVSQTYLDHGDKIKRANYIKRHEVNEKWDQVNAGSLSRFILWGPSTSLRENLDDYLTKFDIKR